MATVITACICFYNAAAELERCLESLDLGKHRKDGIDQAICIDGKYPNFRGKSKISTDGSLGVVKSFPNTTLLAVPDYELHKRNAYLQASEHTSPQTDYILIIDSDEYVDPEQKDWKLFRQDLAERQAKNRGRDIWGLELENNSDDYVETVEQILGRPYQKKKRHSWDMATFEPKPRIWHKPWQFEYHLVHYQWRHKDPNHPEHAKESAVSIAFWEVIKGIRLLHDHKLRSKEHLERRLAYHRWLIQFEQQKVGHYWKHHDYTIPHDLSIVDRWKV